jgi:hypothetical protein
MKTATPTAIPIRPSKTSHARRPRAIGTLNAPAIVVSPETSAKAPKSAISVARPMFGQMRMTTAKAIAIAPRNAVTFQMWVSSCSPSCSCVSGFMSVFLSVELRG